jgi:hypothetical protein
MTRVKDQAVSLLIAVALGAAIWAVATWVAKVNEATAPAVDWFVVHELFIPDHEAGGNPVIVYERTVKKEMSGQWSVETQQEVDGRWVTVCRGSGVSHYSPDEDLPDSVTLRWYRGPCDKPAGTYRLQTVWVFSNAKGVTRTELNVSNEFQVF